MIREAIEKILQVATPDIVQDPASRRTYSTGALTELPGPKPLAATLVIHTLQGIVDYFTSKLDGNSQIVCAHIVSPERVALTSAVFGDFRQRETPILADRCETKGFPFGNFIDIERFVVEMQSRFVQDESVASILKVVGNVKQSQVLTLEDDGVSQQVTTAAGVARVANVVLPNPVKLRPFRTFQEIQQPASLFVLRMRSGQGNPESALPTVALFEVDDCNWKVEAVKGIKLFLEENLDKDFPIFA